MSDAQGSEVVAALVGRTILAVEAGQDGLFLTLDNGCEVQAFGVWTNNDTDLTIFRILPRADSLEGGT